MTINVKKNMKRTTRNNIIRYIVATVLVAIALHIMLLVNIVLYWLTDISGCPVNYVAYIIGFIWLCWFVGKRITIKEDEEE